MSRPWQGQLIVFSSIVLVSMLCLRLAACSSPSVRAGPSPATAVLSLPEGKTLAAIGVTPQRQNGSSAEETVWRDRRVAFGLKNLLAESFYGTGKFRMVEEKDLRQRQLIEELVDLFWNAA